MFRVSTLILYIPLSLWSIWLNITPVRHRHPVLYGGSSLATSLCHHLWVHSSDTHWGAYLGLLFFFTNMFKTRMDILKYIKCVFRVLKAYLNYRYESVMI